jgi:hypothetical protein
MRMTKWSLTLIMALVLGLGLGSSFGFTAANIVSLRLGKDKGVPRESDSFGPRDTIYASAKISKVTDPVDVKAQLFVEDIPGQKPGPIKGLEATVHMAGNGTADFNFSAPTKGWPKGKYGVEVIVVDGHGEETDHKGAEFTVD